MRRIWLAVIVLALAAPASADAYRRDEVREAVTAAGFPELADRAARASRPMVVIGRERASRAPKTLGTSRFGGRPDLPAGEHWPQCAGRGQSFLGQIRLRDLPPAAAELRRLGGVLSVFTAVEFETPDDSSYGLWAGRCATIVHARAGARLTRVARPRGTQQLRIRHARMRFTARPDLPDTNWDGRLGPPMRDVRIAEHRQEAWWAMRDRLHATGLGGQHKLLGYLESVNGESGRCWSNAQRRSRPWQHLITVGPDYGVGFEVADGGRLQVLVDRGDLRRGRFDRICSIFDSA